MLCGVVGRVVNGKQAEMVTAENIATGPVGERKQRCYRCQRAMLLVMCMHRASLGLIAHRGMQGNGQVMVIFSGLFLPRSRHGQRN